jgi:hypothetical protein
MELDLAVGVGERELQCDCIHMHWEATVLISSLILYYAMR